MQIWLPYSSSINHVLGKMKEVQDNGRKKKRKSETLAHQKSMENRNLGRNPILVAMTTGFGNNDCIVSFLLEWNARGRISSAASDCAFVRSPTWSQAAMTSTLVAAILVTLVLACWVEAESENGNSWQRTLSSTHWLMVVILSLVRQPAVYQGKTDNTALETTEIYTAEVVVSCSIKFSTF